MLASLSNTWVQRCTNLAFIQYLLQVSVLFPYYLSSLFAHIRLTSRNLKTCRHRNRLIGDSTRVVGRHEEDNLRHFTRLDNVTERAVLTEGALHLLREHAGIGRTWSNVVHTDPVLAVIKRHSARHVDDGCLRSVVGGHAIIAEHSRNRRDVYNGTLASLHHLGKERLGCKKRAFDIRIEDAVPVIGALLELFTYT